MNTLEPVVIMKILDLDYCDFDEVSQELQVEGGAFAYASSSSVATKGFSGSSFKAFSSGKSFSLTLVNVKQRSFSLPKSSFSFSSTSAFAYAKD